MHLQIRVTIALMALEIGFACGQAQVWAEGTALFPVWVDGKYGFINARGEIVIAPQFKSAHEFTDDGLALVDRDPSDNDDSGGYVDASGRVVFRTKFRSGDFHCGRARFYDRRFSLPTSKLGYLDPDGRIAITPKYDLVEEFEHGVALVGKATFLGIYCRFVSGGAEGHYDYTYVDRSGKELGDPEFNADGLIPEDTLLPLKKGEKYGYVDLTGRFVVAPQYDDAKAFREGRAAVKRGELYGFIDPQGKLVIEHRYFNVRPFSEGLACVGSPDAPSANWYGVVDLEGNWTVPPSFYQIESYSGGLAVIQVDDAHGKYGFIDRAGSTRH